MALYTVAAGATVQAADLNQYYNLLTGAMTDQNITFLGGSFLVGGDAAGYSRNSSSRLSAFVGAAANGIAGGFIVFNSNGPTGNDGAYISYNPPLSGTNSANRMHITGPAAGSLAELDLSANEVYCTLDLNVQRNVSSAAGSIYSSGALYASGGLYQCLEMPNTNRNHLEYSVDTSSVNVGSGGIRQTTLSFTRAFAFTPAVSACCTVGGASPHVSTDTASISTSSVTITFTNHDSNTQPISNMTVIAVGA